MSKLEVLKYNRAMMTVLGIYPRPATSPSYLKWLQSISPYYIYSTNCASFVLGVMYIYQGSKPLGLLFEAFADTIGVGVAFLAYVNLRWKVDQIGGVQLKLQEIVDQGTAIHFQFASHAIAIVFPLCSLHFSAADDKKVTFIYWNVEKKCHRFMKRLSPFVVIQQTGYCFALLYSIYNVCVSNFDTSTYFLPLRLATPFNTDTVFKFYLFLMVHLSIGYSYLFCAIPTISYFVCWCFYLNGLVDHFDYLFGLLNAEFEENEDEPNDRATAYENSLRARKLLSNAIDLHNKIYE